MNVLRETIVNHGIEVLIVDPAYLCMPSADAGNLFANGPLLKAMAHTCDEGGAQLVLIHHFKKQGVDRRYVEPELEDIAYSGFQEFARQWILLGRRGKYVEGSGYHQLWLKTGGSAGHGGCWALDIEEGPYEFGQERIWAPHTQSVTAARKQIQEAREQKSRQRKQEKEIENRRRILTALREFGTAGETSTVIKNRAAMGPDVAGRTLFALEEDGLAETCKVKKANKQEYDGWRGTPLALDEDSDAGEDTTSDGNLGGLFDGEDEDHLSG